MTVNGETKVLGIIGNPIHHTKSPLIHNYISEKMNINMIYVPFEVKNDVIAAVKGAYELSIHGMNVTVPYKTDVIPCLCDIDDLAKRIGAVNTLVRTENGYKGYNTDMLGLERAVFSENIALKGKNTVLLGAGGAARAVAFMCARNEAKKIFILNRTVSKAVEIADDVSAFVKEKGFDTKIYAKAMNDYNSILDDNLVVFQCTKIGLNESDGAVVEDPNFYKKIQYGVDLIYRDTEFCRLVNEAGGKSYNGLKMLMYQGIIAYELWNNVSIPEDVVSGVEKVLNNG